MKKIITVPLKVIMMAHLLLFSCQGSEPHQEDTNAIPEGTANPPAEALPAKDTLATIAFSDLPDSALVNVLEVDSRFVLDVKYATTDNFTGEVLYPCATCLLRKSTTVRLIQALDSLEKLGYGIKLFDCYRPYSVQKSLWEKVPDPRYVADPAKGSMHNRGNAVDLTLIDPDGNEIEMGSAYDTFGRISHHVNRDLPKEILDRRDLLKGVMEHFELMSITSEWWHYAYTDRPFPIMDEPLPCE